MKLNLGCGNDIRDGYTNVDLHANGRPGIICCDLSQTPWPWESNSVEEVMMLDFLEHFPYHDTQRILFEVNRVLAPYEKVVIQVPDFTECSRALNQDVGMLCNKCGFKFEKELYLRMLCQQCGRRPDEISESAMQRLYGGQDYPGNWHFTAFTRRSLLQNLTKSGFTNFKTLEEDHQRVNWNMKVSAIKIADPAAIWDEQ